MHPPPSFWTTFKPQIKCWSEKYSHRTTQLTTNEQVYILCKRSLSLVLSQVQFIKQQPQLNQNRQIDSLLVRW